MPKLVIAAILAVGFALAVPSMAGAQCRSVEVPVKVNLAKGFGRVVYDHSKARKEFAGAVGADSSMHDTLGLTKAELMVNGTAENRIVKVEGGYCVVLSAVNMQLFYEDILVLIDRKYPVGSCEYNTVVRHENQHVAIARKVLDFYSPYVKLEIEKITAKMGAKFYASERAAQRAAGGSIQHISRELEPMMELIQEQLEKGNRQFDTHEKYREETSRCSNW